MDAHDDEWWAIFRRASQLRERLHEVKRRRTYDGRNRADRREIRRETAALLLDVKLRQPMRLLLLDLMGYRVDRWPAAMFTLAQLEAQHPGAGATKLTKLLRPELARLKARHPEADPKEYKPRDEKQIKRWRKDPRYQHLLLMLGEGDSATR